MSEILDCDPNKGFVAFPVALFDLDLTPGAFRTLAELCRMANASGQCWPSLAQLGRRLGRSRAAVSGYIAELRTAGVLTTEEQKMANGYNYRLRYTVTFWKEWRADLSKDKARATTVPAKKHERRVQPVERPLETKNHIYKKQQSGSFDDLVSQWKSLAGQAPYPGFAAWPSDELVARTGTALTKEPDQPPIISADIAKALSMFAAHHQIEQPSTEVIAAVEQHLTSMEMLDALMKALNEQWQTHWRKPPNVYQILRIIKDLPRYDGENTKYKLLKSYLRRWKLYQRSLPSLAISSKVAA
ncbi:helix-turn-helix domain-containing protein [uncultured Sulfitobacter sp.]|uniref:helix-turn-helix domain-containing protein n=1 Tax=uncultured Sulfitobacter sp. TaxID=191468 RepID=UPI002606CD55|nr:helix-turn-helix domain-containing protein [uncultured Sulfitobacter sp.]